MRRKNVSTAPCASGSASLSTRAYSRPAGAPAAVPASIQSAAAASGLALKRSAAPDQPKLRLKWLRLAPAAWAAWLSAAAMPAALPFNWRAAASATPSAMFCNSVWRLYSWARSRAMPMKPNKIIRSSAKVMNRTPRRGRAQRPWRGERGGGRAGVGGMDGIAAALIYRH